MDLDKNKTIALLTVAAGSSLLALAALYFLSKESENVQEDIIEAVKLLGEAKFSSENKEILDK